MNKTMTSWKKAVSITGNIHTTLITINPTPRQAIRALTENGIDAGYFADLLNPETGQFISNLAEILSLYPEHVTPEQAHRIVTHLTGTHDTKATRQAPHLTKGSIALQLS